MKIRLDKITVTQVEVEMPDACPSCGAGWQEEVLEDQLVLATETGWKCIAPGEAGIIFDDQGESEVCYDAGAYVTGYTCASCAMAIVSSENPVQINQKQEKLQGV